MVVPPGHLLRRQRKEEKDEEIFVGLLALWLLRRRWHRHAWVVPWILRRQLFGHYDTLMVEPEHESHGDLGGVMRMEPALFHELFMRLTQY